jgi:putative peptidoglycan lipid II flippase
MIRSILSVGGWTLVSRVTGLVRDLVMAAVLGAGQLMDVFALAFRLPNHFRAIFAEGAFSSAFVPAYTRLLTERGDRSAAVFQGRILSLLMLAQMLLLATAWLFMPGVITLMGGGSFPQPKFDLAVDLTRITFPYLLLITLVTLWSGALNAVERFSVAAAAPVLLNLSLLTAMALAAQFATAAHAAAWGVFAAGVLEAALLGFAAWQAGVLARPRWPRIDSELKRFFRAFGPAVIGSAGVQIAMLADTIIAQQLIVGSASALYYADRIYQLPLGVIAIAAGTVLLPTMSRFLAEGDEPGANRAQNRVAAFTLLLSAPFWVATLIIPELIIRAVFLRGAFTAANATLAAQVLASYGVGLIAAVSIRAAIASFHARGDTATPMVISLSAIAFNLLLKIVLAEPLGVAGLALSTGIGASVNLALLLYVGANRDWIRPDRLFKRTVLAVVGGAFAMAAMMLLLNPVVVEAAQLLPLGRDVAALMLHGLIAALVYGAVVLFLLRRLAVGLNELAGARRRKP